MGIVCIFGAWAISRQQYSVLALHTSFAVFMSLILIGLYARGFMGGGDVKLLAAAFLWVGWNGSLLFSILLLAASVLYTLGVKLELFPSLGDGNRREIPFGPSIALALLATVLLTGPPLG
jgi:prepilin peptidase CpaA